MNSVFSIILPIVSAGPTRLISKGGPLQLLSRLRFSAKPYQHLQIQDKGSTLYVHLNRPDLHNAFNEELIAEVTDCFKSVSNKYRNVILTGNGKSFSAGADLHWMGKMVNYSEQQNRQDSLQLFDMFDSIKKCRLPTIARVNGPAIGGGCGLVAACDIAVAVDSANFAFTEVRLGLIPAVISPFVISKIGNANASRYFLTGSKFSADQALKIGLVNQTAPSIQEVDNVINELIKELSNSGPEAVSACKILLQNIGNYSGRYEQLRLYLASEIAKIRISQEGQNGIKSFLDKKKPNWTL